MRECERKRVERAKRRKEGAEPSSAILNQKLWRRKGENTSARVGVVGSSDLPQFHPHRSNSSFLPTSTTDDPITVYRHVRLDSVSLTATPLRQLG